MSSPEAIANEVFCLEINWLTEQYRVKFCQSFEGFLLRRCNEEKIAAILLLFPDEFGIISKLFE